MPSVSRPASLSFTNDRGRDSDEYMHEMTYLDNLEQLDGLRDDVNAELAAPALAAQLLLVAVNRPRRP